MEYGYRKQLNMQFDQAVEKTKKALSEESFGVLTEVDVKETLKKKMDVDFESYVILGACNPPYAYEALKSEKEIGLMLPCNVIVYETDGNIFVSAIMPSMAMGMIQNDKLKSIAQEVEDKLKRVIDAI